MAGLGDVSLNLNPNPKPGNVHKICAFIAKSKIILDLGTNGAFKVLKEEVMVKSGMNVNRYEKLRYHRSLSYDPPQLGYLFNGREDR